MKPVDSSTIFPLAKRMFCALIVQFINTLSQSIRELFIMKVVGLKIMFIQV